MTENLRHRGYRCNIAPAKYRAAQIAWARECAAEMPAIIVAASVLRDHRAREAAEILARAEA
jgi:hypothetical protein